jgi:guanine deaminase
MRALFRGRIFSFRRAPKALDDEAAFIYIEDGFLLIEDKIIVGIYDFDKLPSDWSNHEYVDYRPHIIMPGFIDTHNHFPQLQVIASYGTQLMDWLERYTFPEEAKFGDYNYSKAAAKTFLDTLVNNGTTTSVSFGSVHKESVEVLFKEAEKYNMCLIAGKVMMDRNAPASVLDTAQSSYDDSKSLIKKWHKKNRAYYAISPRFGITSTPEQLDLAGSLVSEFSDCYLQTHISENVKEIELTLSLFPERKNYLDIYMHHGLVGAKSLLGHSIHLDSYELSQMKEMRAVAVHCPTSNLFLGSGLFDLVDLKSRGIRTAVASDTGGGTSHSMLQTLADAYKIQQLLNFSLNPLESLYWGTLGNACALGLNHEIGSFEVGSFADFIVLNSHATKLSDTRMKTCENLIEELFIVQTLGDDRFIKSVYISGKKQK